MENAAEIYRDIGIIGFLLILVGTAVWHGGHLLRLVLQRKLNGKIAMYPDPVSIPAPACPWSDKLSREWDSVVKGSKESAAGSKRFEDTVWPAFMRGDMECKWSSKDVSALITEIRLLRREMELARNGRKGDADGYR